MRFLAHPTIVMAPLQLPCNRRGHCTHLRVVMLALNAQNNCRRVNNTSSSRWRRWPMSRHRIFFFFFFPNPEQRTTHWGNTRRSFCSSFKRFWELRDHPQDPGTTVLHHDRTFIPSLRNCKIAASGEDCTSKLISCCDGRASIRFHARTVGEWEVFGGVVLRLCKC